MALDMTVIILFSLIYVLICLLVSHISVKNDEIIFITSLKMMEEAIDEQARLDSWSLPSLPQKKVKGAS